ncbi:unnamed protein product, partial [Ixodes pacificus]
QKTTSDYLEGLLDLDACGQNGHLELVAGLPPTPPAPSLAPAYQLAPTGSITLRCVPLHLYREELMASIARKLDVLRVERVSLRDEASQNEQLGQALSVRVDLLARPAERDKFRLHVDELDKIVNLLLSLSGRLARVHNALTGLPADEASQERRALEAKRDKLTSQHEEARRLKESIDKRSRQVALFLRRYLSPQEYADYGHFVRMKSKLLVDAREIDDKIRLGEEQLTALRTGGQGSTVTPWKPMAS